MFLIWDNQQSFIISILHIMLRFIIRIMLPLLHHLYSSKWKLWVVLE